jgi:hypothetical protein
MAELTVQIQQLRAVLYQLIPSLQAKYVPSTPVSYPAIYRNLPQPDKRI